GGAGRAAGSDGGLERRVSRVNRRSWIMHVRTAASIAALALGLAACGSGGTSAAGGSSGGSATSITVGYVPYGDDVALFLAKEKGFFTRHGLNVTLTPAANPI